LPECKVSDLQVQTAAESGAVIRAAFEGQAPIPCSMVLANTAAALLACEKVSTLQKGVDIAKDAIQSGAATNLLNRLIQWTRSI
jgi:anthranilate phosphoribosyltransferase